MEKTSLESMLQIANNIHERLMVLESSAKTNDLGAYIGYSGQTEQSALALMSKIGRSFHWTASDMDDRFKCDNIYTFITNDSDFHHLQSLPKDDREQILRDLQDRTGNDRNLTAIKAGISLIILQIVLDVKILPDIDIAFYIVRAVNSQFYLDDCDDHCKNMLQRFITMIKNALNDSIASMVCRQLTLGRLIVLDPLFEQNGFMTDLSVPAISRHSDPDFDISGYA
jgi:hypothetical protein